MSTVKKQSLFFSISGEFVTNTARDWLYAERRSYKDVLEFLLSCMCGTDIPLLRLKRYANDVLLGKRKFIGNTKDDSFCMVNDNVNVIEKYPMYFERRYRKKKLINNIIDPHTHIKIPKARAKALNLDRTILNLVKQNHVEKTIIENFGWLSPEGKFFEAEWGSHNRWASDYIEKYYPDIDTAPFSEGYYSEDFLIKRGWILLHNPYNPHGYADIESTDLYKATQKQKEFLFDYFMARGMPESAKEMLKEDNL